MVDRAEEVYGRGWAFPPEFKLPAGAGKGGGGGGGGNAGAGSGASNAGASNADTGSSTGDADAASGVRMVSGLEDIRQSMQVLFRTEPGERIMRAGYGCDLNSSIFENIREDLLADITRKITDSILRHEPRVELESVQVAPDLRRPSTLSVHVIYRPRGTDALERLSGSLDLGDGRTRGFP